MDRRPDPPASTPIATALAAAILLILAVVSGPAAGAPLPAYPTVEPGPSSTQWYPDRYRPAVFANAGALFGRANVLALGISSADADGLRGAFNGAFYNTQGRKIDVDAAAPASFVASVYLPASFAVANPADATLTRRTDAWGTLHDAGGTAVAYPIIGFTNQAGTGFNGGTPRYRAWDNTSGWVDLATPVAFDAWTDLCVTFTGTSIEYRIGDTLVYTDTTAAIATAAALGDVMLQGYNFGFDYSANWSYVAAGPGTCAQLRAEVFPAARGPSIPVPVGPLAPLVAAVGIALAALATRRR
jgi:hypothetical protein